jgi:hypothetical protein
MLGCKVISLLGFCMEAEVVLNAVFRLCTGAVDSWGGVCMEELVVWGGVLGERVSLAGRVDWVKLGLQLGGSGEVLVWWIMIAKIQWLLLTLMGRMLAVDLRTKALFLSICVLKSAQL